MNRKELYLKHFKKVSEAIRVANYKRGYILAGKALKLFPEQPLAELDYYTIMADYGAVMGGSEGRRLHKRGTKGLCRMIKKIRSFDEEDRSFVKNEVYFQTRQFKKQYELGISEYKKTKNLRCFYSSGVGAAWYANDMFKKRQIKRCQSWAQKSVDAWEKFWGYRKDYYNAYIHYALALGFLGRTSEMEKALKTAQKISKKPASFSEFANIRNIIKNFQTR